MSAILNAETNRQKQIGTIGTVPISMYKELEAKLEMLQKQFENFKNAQPAQKPANVTFADKSQIIPQNVLSSTCVEHVTSKDLLEQQYLRASSDIHSSVANKNAIQQNSSASNDTNDADKSANNSRDDDDSTDKTRGRLNVSETILLEQAQVSKAASIAQREMTNAMSLELRRKSLPKIGKFNGEPKDWIRFKRDVKRWQEIGRFDDDLMKMYILQALDGVALQRVQDMIDTAPLDHTMKMLEEGFGDTSRIIDKCGQDILNLRLDKDLYRDDVMSINTKIQAYFSACLYADIGYANTNYLAKHIFEQLSPHNKQFYRHHFRSLHPKEANKLMDLESMFTFFEDLAKDLEDKRKSEKKEQKSKAASVMYTPIASNQSVPRGGDDYLYEIRDKATAPFIGYDMAAVNAITKRCECCNKANHFSVQCRNYKSMDDTARLKLIADKGLCKNCMLATSHRAMNCTVKASCGFRIGNNRCSQKHHISLHKALANNSGRFNFRNGSNRSNRRSNTNANTKRSTEIANQGLHQSSSNASLQHQSTQITPSAPEQEHNSAPSIHDLPRRQAHAISVAASSSNVPVNYELLSYNAEGQVLNISSSMQRTVKIFKNHFLGEKTYVTGFSVGDSAAEVTLVREDLRQALKIEGTECEVDVQWTDNSRRKLKATLIDLCIQGVHKNARKLTLKNCYAVNALDFPSRSLDIAQMKKQFPYLKNVKFDGYKDMKPWLLIGSPHASVIESCGKLYEEGEGKPVGLFAKLGWTVYGGCPEEYGNIPCCIQSITKGTETLRYVPEIQESISNEKLYEMFSFFSSVESLGISGKSHRFTEDEQKAIKIVTEEMRSLPDGSIEVPLAWDKHGDKIPTIPDNLAMVIKRQTAQEAKLRKNPEHLKAFNDNFQELIQEGYVRAATKQDTHGDWKNVWYLPMSLVVNANKVPVKYRNVFDASARYNGTSLNENLLKGPDLLVDLLQPLLRMRENRVAFTADIKSMFLRMKVSLRDQQCQRLLWRNNPEDAFRVYIMTSVLFGPTCSPFESQIVKNMTADKWAEMYPEAARTIKLFMYMDDLISSEPSVEKAIEIAKQCIAIFLSINWHLVTFQSNSVEFMKALPQANVKQDLIPLLENDIESCTTKVLGCHWDPKTDCFVFRFDKNLFIRIVKELNHRPTKRDQSSTLARIFDVMGLISHYTIRGKILLQRSWYSKLDWDDEICDAEHANWLKWLHDAEKVATLKIKRVYSSINSLRDADKLEIHTFCDAGDEAIAAVSYMVVTTRGHRDSNIIMAKARVAPLRLKSQTKICEIPRLELYAALLAARLTETITNCYEGIKFIRYLWSDSEVVLRWLLNGNHKLLKYAIAPVEEILEKTERSEWRFVPTKSNVADIATKFTKFNFADSNSVWFTGPPFLRMREENWPAMPNLESKGERNREVVTLNSINMRNIFFLSSQKLPPNDCPVAKDCLVDSFSAAIKGSWKKLLRATARGLKLHYDGLVPLLKSKMFHDEQTRERIRDINDAFTTLTASDFERAELFLVRKAQKEAMPEIYKKLRNNQEIVDDELRQLNVFMDSEGVIRINSRVDLSPTIYPQRIAPFLPRKTALTRVLLLHFHYEFKHVCLESQIAAVRAKFWIPQVRTALKSIRTHCSFCNLRKAKPYAPLMAPLPQFRVDPAQRPFEVVGLDCAGPIKVLMHTTWKEVYILIFSCTLTRFVHLHLLDSLKTIGVLNAIATFWAAHGPVRMFVSDNGRNFTGASNFLKEQHAILAGHLSETRRCDWRFIPAHSPWMGGFYERLIKEVKRSVEHVLQKRKLQKIELNIALQDAAHRLNCRPLTHNAVEAEDEPVLTPHHLAKYCSGWPLLPGLRSSLPIPDNKQDKNVYYRGRAIADAIMRKFVCSYLPELTKRSKWFKEQKPLQVGDLVLIIEPNQTRQEWQRGRIVKLYKSRDSRSRVADVLRHDGVMKTARSIQRLAKIEIRSIDNAA